MKNSKRNERINKIANLINRLKDENFRNQYELLERVCSETGLSMGDLLYNRGDENCSLSRHAFWYLLNQKFNMGPSRITRETGRDHSTVIYGLNNIQDYLQRVEEE